MIDKIEQMPIFRKKNDNFFSQWSAEMSYVLGYFAADGTMVKNKRGAHYLAFWSTDSELIESVRTLLNSNHAIRIRKRFPRHKTIYRIQFGSKKMFSDLVKLGFTPNKSKTLRFPNIPAAYLSHFVRGYFDGDGHVNTGVYRRSRPREKSFIRILQSGFTSGSSEFLRIMKYKLEKFAGLKGGTFYFLERGFRLGYSVHNSIKLHKFMYTGVSNGIYLKRKRDIFEKYMNIVGR